MKHFLYNPGKLISGLMDGGSVSKPNITSAGDAAADEAKAADEARRKEAAALAAKEGRSKSLLVSQGGTTSALGTKKRSLLGAA